MVTFKCAKASEKIKPVRIGHAYIADDNVRTLNFNRRQSLLRTTSSNDPRTAILQHATNKIARIGVIVYDEHAEAGQVW